MNFYVPPKLEQDFDDFLKNDIPGAVQEFVIIHDWYDQFNEDYEPYTAKAEIYPDSAFSRYTNMDNLSWNIRFSKKTDIRKGDIVQQKDGSLYLCDWAIGPSPNDKRTRPVRCNCKLTFRRWVPLKVDFYGYLLQEQGYQNIAEQLPCNAYRYDGRPQFSAASGKPGVVGNAQTIIYVQYNQKTKDLQIDDQFVWGKDTYIIIDISYGGIDINQHHGVLTLQTKKKAGGQVA